MLSSQYNCKSTLAGQPVFMILKGPLTRKRVVSLSYRNSGEDASTSSSALKDQETKAESTEASDLPTEDLEAKIAESKRMAWGAQESEGSTEASKKDATPTTNQTSSPQEPPASKTASELSIDELEAELQRRRSSANSTS